MKMILHSLMIIGTIIILCVGCSNNHTENETVYVSKTGKIHKFSNCSGMQYYTEMLYDEALDNGYDFCMNCY